MPAAHRRAPMCRRELRQSTAAALRTDPGFVRDHLLQALEIRHHRGLVYHSDLADDRRAIREDSRVVRADHVRADPHDLGEALRHNAEVASFDTRAQRMENHHASPARGRRNHLAAGAFERHERNGFAIPGHSADIPRWRPCHFGRDLEANDLRDARARNDEPPVRNRHQQAVDLCDSFSHYNYTLASLTRSNAPLLCGPRRRSTSGAIASSNCASWYGLPR